MQFIKLAQLLYRLRKFTVLFVLLETVFKAKLRQNQRAKHRSRREE